MASPLTEYLKTCQGGATEIDPTVVAYLANLECVRAVSPEIAAGIVREFRDQRQNLKMIASENYSSIAVQAAMGNLLTDKYAEGIPHARYYAGCDNVDDIEARAVELAKELFGAKSAYVQPHSGADANLIAFWAILRARVEDPWVRRELGLKETATVLASHLMKVRDTGKWPDMRAAVHSKSMMALEFASGGHLTHGSLPNVSSRMFDIHTYGADPNTGLLDYAVIEEKARAARPLILLAGYSAYPRLIDFAEMKRIATAVGAVFVVDMAHFAGLVAGKVMTGRYDPVPHADVVTTTTHKTLRGPRGGMVLCNDPAIDAHVQKGCPLVIGGPLPHVMAAKAVAFQEALRPEFATYAARVVANARALADGLVRRGLRVATGGTDNHLVLVDLRARGLSGLQGEKALRACGITLNRNALPGDTLPPTVTCGLRLGTPAVTTLGMGPDEMDRIAATMALVLGAAVPRADAKGHATEVDVPEHVAAEARRASRALLDRFPLYPQLNLGVLEAHFLPAEPAPRQN